MSKYEDRWLGDRQIKLTQEAGSTRNGIPLLKVVFNDGTNAVYSQKMLDSEGVVTPERGDPTALRTARMFGPVKEILDVMLAYNVRYDELNYLTQLVLTSLNMNEERATAHLWGVAHCDERSMDQIDRVMEQMDKKVTLKDVLKS